MNDRKSTGEFLPGVDCDLLLQVGGIKGKKVLGSTLSARYLAEGRHFLSKSTLKAIKDQS